MKPYLVNNELVLARNPNQAITIYLDQQIAIPARIVCKPFPLSH